MLRSTRQPFSGRTWLVAVLLAAVAAGTLVAAEAHAKVWFQTLEGRKLAWGQRVSATILGCPGNDSCRATVQGVTVYLRRGPVRRTGARRRNLHRVATITTSGKVSFRVPRVPPGRYHLVAWVTIGDWDRWMPISGTFRITRR